MKRTINEIYGVHEVHLQIKGILVIRDNKMVDLD
jgi:hypothetical protein